MVHPPRRLSVLPLTLAMVAALAMTATAATVVSTGRSSPVDLRPVAVNGDNLSPTPPMGFNNWARYECGVTEAIMVRNADALVSTGLAAKGYNTVTVDDCWMARSRD